MIRPTWKLFARALAKQRAKRSKIGFATCSEVGDFLDALPGGRERYGLAFKRVVVGLSVSHHPEGAALAPMVETVALVVEALGDDRFFSVEA